MVPSKHEAIERLVRILDRQESLIRAQKNHIHALQMKVKVLERQKDMEPGS
jgi:hypothetical protein